MKSQCFVAAIAVAVVGALATGHAQSKPNDKPSFAGSWALNADLSDSPQQVGFGPGGAGAGNGLRAGGGGRRGGGGFGRGGGRGFGGGGGTGSGGTGTGSDGSGTQAAQDADRNKIQELTSEVRTPSATLLIVQDDSSLTVTDADGRTRVFETNGKKEPHQFTAGTIDSKTKWDGNKLVTEYDLGSGRKLRYTYSIVSTTKQLLVQVTFDGGQGQTGKNALTIKQVYDATPLKPE